MSGFLTLAGWTFLPNWVTGWLQSIYYGITIRAGDPKPQPGSPRFIKHRRRIYMFVISAYLLYTIYEADYNIRRDSDYYQELGIAHSATTQNIRSRMRRLATIYHPDKVSTPGAADYFVHLKHAQDVLIEPAKRFAYDRFGPSILGYQHCSSIGDYVKQGLIHTLLPHYIITGAAMYVLGMLGYLEWGKYWRWLTLFVLCTFELHTVTRPNYPFLVANIINPVLTTFTTRAPYLPYQAIQLARKLSITLYIAFSQLGPLLGDPSAASKSSNPEVQMKFHVDRAQATALALDNEATRQLEMEMAPFARDPEALRDLQTKITDWLVQNTIRRDPEVQDAIGKSLKRRRTDAPAGARGNR